jgi:membrane fusion protein (multidrug efflux system)
MNGRLRVHTAVEQSVIIPSKAINEQLGEFYVYLADSSKATQRKVVVGRQVGKDVIIKEGLQGGEPIITEGIQNLREGTPIQIASPEATK